MPSFPKNSPYRNQKLLDSSRDAEYCAHCKKSNDGTIVPAHPNEQRYGKGYGIKAHDLIADLCSDCHRLLDEELGREEAHLMFLEAFYESMLWRLRTGRLVVK